MEILSIPVLVIAIVVAFYFKNVVKATANTLETTVNTVNLVADDSLKTYRNEVRILNAEKRADQLKKLSSFDTIVTNDDIEALLNTSTHKSEE